jgi:hypothetical protein
MLPMDRGRLEASARSLSQAPEGSLRDRGSEADLEQDCHKPQYLMDLPYLSLLLLLLEND